MLLNILTLCKRSNFVEFWAEVSNSMDQRQRVSDFLFFLFLFVACLLGSFGILIFAVGLETGNKIIQTVMQSLLDQASVVIILFLVFNLIIVGFYKIMVSKRKKVS